MKSFTVHPHEEGVKLLRWLKKHFPHITRGLLEKGIRKGWVKIDKKKPDANQVLVAEQIISIAEYLCDMDPDPNAQKTDKNHPNFARMAEEHSAPNPRDIKRFRDMIVFENDELIAINKPAGLAVQGGSKQKISVDVLAKSIATRTTSPRLVHRLDKDTSGVLVMAKTAKAATRLTKLFASHEIEKHYKALVIGVPKPKRGQIDMPLLKSMKNKHTDYEKVDVDVEEGKDAVTRYEVTHTAAQKYAWVNLYPITGRTHQLRVHMANINHPIVGDGKYGGPEAFRAGDNLAKQLHLHAASITIPGLGGKPLTITAEMPAHMKKSWELLGGD